MTNKIFVLENGDATTLIKKINSLGRTSPKDIEIKYIEDTVINSLLETILQYILSRTGSVLCKEFLNFSVMIVRSSKKDMVWGINYGVQNYFVELKINKHSTRLIRILPSPLRTSDSFVGMYENTHDKVPKLRNDTIVHTEFVLNMENLEWGRTAALIANYLMYGDVELQIDPEVVMH